MEQLNNLDIRVQSGRMLDVKQERIETPFRFDMKVRKHADGTSQRPRLRAYYERTELLREDVVGMLQKCGVDNLQIFSAMITKEGTNKAIDNYFVVNIVGLVTCAAVEASDATHFVDGIFFDRLVINPIDARGLLMFRLAESRRDILIHERVATELERQEFPFLVVTPLRGLCD